MLQTILAALCAALLVATSTLAARRWGLRTGGVVSAFPAIVGPVLVLVAVQHGPDAAARNAEGTLLGLVGLASFVIAYGRTAACSGWRTSLLSGWFAAGVASCLVAAGRGWFGPPAGLIAAAASLWVAYRALPELETGETGVTRRSPPSGAPRAPGEPRPARETSIFVRAGLTAAILLALAAAVAALGPFIGGILAALPVLASVLAVVTHRDAGPAAAVALLRGTLAGMAGFVTFCEIVALLVTRTPLLPAFAAATVVALVVQTPALRTR